MAFNIAKIMNTLHAFNPSITHSHLSAHNIFIEFQIVGGHRKVYGVRIGDIELSPLIKYASTFYSYKNLSVWTAPELLKGVRRMGSESIS
jgi:hypothetical protein